MIKNTTFDGAHAVEVRTAKWKMVLITEFGPRIAFLGAIDDDNILYWDKNGVSRDGWKLHGGHRVWFTRPFADEAEDTYMEDNQPCDVKIEENTVTATADPHPFTRLSRSIRIDVVKENTFRVTNMIRNNGQMISSGGVWSPTCINPEGKKIFIDLGEDNATWDIVKIVIPRVFAGNTIPINDKQITFTENQMIVTPMGFLTKRCVGAPKGRIYTFWAEKNITFTKQVSYNRNGRYPLDGCNVAVFVDKDNWMAEMETFGEEKVIRPGETITNEEMWILS